MIRRFCQILLFSTLSFQISFTADEAPHKAEGMVQEVHEKILFKDLESYFKDQILAMKDSPVYINTATNKLSDNGEAFLTFYDHWYHYLDELNEIYKLIASFTDVSEEKIEKMKEHYQKANNHSKFMNEFKMAPGINVPSLPWLGTDDNGVLNTVVNAYTDILKRPISDGFRTYLDLCLTSMAYAGEKGVTFITLLKPFIVSVNWQDSMVISHLKELQKIFFDCRKYTVNPCCDSSCYGRFEQAAHKSSEIIQKIRGAKISAELGILLEHMTIPFAIRVFLDDAGVFDKARVTESREILKAAHSKRLPFLYPANMDDHKKYPELKQLSAHLHCIRDITFFMTGVY